MTQSSLRFLANHPLPFEVGTIAMRPDGTAEWRDRTALNFTFDYVGTSVTAAIEPTPDGAQLRLDAALAPMPYSAEGRDRRRDVNAIVAASRSGLTHGQFVLDSQRQIHLVSELAIGSPVTPVALVTAATRMLIAATPWIALLRRHLGPVAAPPPAASLGSNLGPNLEPNPSMAVASNAVTGPGA
jgi:hypothetical protein